jgi:SAM-dependent methyltransferase
MQMRWPFLKKRLTPIEQLRKSLSDLQRAAFFAPTPWAIARQMLELAEVTPGDVVYDLGSGDGRIPILAAQEFGCRAVGIEMDEELFEYSSRSVAELNLQDRVTFERADFFRADFRPATVVTMYLLSAVNGYLRPRLASQLRGGSRIVALDFDVPGWRAERTIEAKSEGDVDYTLLLYRRQSLPESLDKILCEASRMQALQECRQPGGRDRTGRHVLELKI